MPALCLVPCKRECSFVLVFNFFTSYIETSKQAPCLIVIFKEWYKTLEDGTKDQNYYVNESIGISIGFLINALRNAGLASLTYTPAPPTFLRTLLGRPEEETLVMVLVVGKPDPNYKLPILKKKSFEEIAEII